MKFFGKSDKLAVDIAVGNAADFVEPSHHAGEKQIPLVGKDNSIERMPSKDAQAGVQKVEAVTLVWTKNELMWAYAW